MTYQYQYQVPIFLLGIAWNVQIANKKIMFLTPYVWDGVVRSEEAKEGKKERKKKKVLIGIFQMSELHRKHVSRNQTQKGWVGIKYPKNIFST